VLFHENPQTTQDTSGDCTTWINPARSQQFQGCEPWDCRRSRVRTLKYPIVQPHQTCCDVVDRTGMQGSFLNQALAVPWTVHGAPPRQGTHTLVQTLLSVPNLDLLLGTGRAMPPKAFLSERFRGGDVSPHLHSGALTRAVLPIHVSGVHHGRY
jgi:hypothetical protein